MSSSLHKADFFDKEVQIELRSFTVLVGLNSSGKSRLVRTLCEKEGETPFIIHRSVQSGNEYTDRNEQIQKQYCDALFSGKKYIHLEHVDVSLHPHSQQKLIHDLIKQFKNYGLQHQKLIIETHSAFIISAFHNAISYEMIKSKDFVTYELVAPGTPGMRNGTEKFEYLDDIFDQSFQTVEIMNITNDVEFIISNSEIIYPRVL